MKQQVLQTEFKYTYDGIIYKLYNMWNRSSKREKTYNYTSFYQSAFTWPVRSVLPTGQTGRHYPEASTGQTGPTDWSDRSTQNRGATHSTLQCATQQLPSLGVSFHHLPPLCIPADELDTAGAKVNVWMA